MLWLAKSPMLWMDNSSKCLWSNLQHMLLIYSVGCVVGFRFHPLGARSCKDRIQDALFSVIRYVSYLLFLYFLERLHYDAIPRSAMLVSSDRIF